MNLYTFILLGRSGCGKGTQAELLQKWLQKESPETPAFHLEVGAKFRSFIAEPSYTSSLATAINDKGGLQPEFLAVWAWTDELIKGLNGNEHLIVDGTPRKLDEAMVFDKALDFYGRTSGGNKPFVINLDVSRDWSRKHLLARHRADDNSAEIEARLDWYDKEVVPAIAFFKKNPRYHYIEVDGSRSIEQVHADILTLAGLSGQR